MIPLSLQDTEKTLGQDLGRLSTAAEDDFRLFGRLIGTTKTGEIGQLARARQFVKAFGIARLANLDGRVDVDLDELVRGDEIAGHPPLAAERRDEAHKHNQTSLDHQLRDLGDTANVLDPIFVGEAEIAIEPVTNIVAVKQNGVPPELVQHLLEQIGDGGFAGARQSGEPEDTGFLPDQCRARRFVDFERLPVNIGGTSQSKRDHSAPDGCVIEAIDQNEPAHLSVFRIRIEWRRPIKRDVAKADVIQIEMLGGDMFERIDADFVLQLGNLPVHDAGAGGDKV